MLIEVHIHHLITIDHLELNLKNGTTVITGESGVGKSILMDAIELALGARANADLVRPNQEKADISLCFDLTDLPEAKAWLRQYDMQNDSNECVIRRTLFKDGRSRSYINQLPTTLQPLREFSELLINIHGQHEHQTLLKSDIQRTLLDRYANQESTVLKLEHLAQEWHRLRNEIENLKTKETERTARAEYLKFQLDELQALNLSTNEFETLDQEHKQLAHGDELINNLQQALQTLAENEQSNAIQHLNQSLHALEVVQRVNPKIANWVEALKTILIQATDLEDEVRRYLETVEIDPAELKRIEERLSVLFNLARKHKIDPHELYQFQQNLNKEFLELDQSSERIEQLNKEMQQLEKEYRTIAETVSKNRASFAKKLAKQITQTIQTLSLPHGKFEIRLEPLDAETLHAHGSERIIFEIQTNPDQPLLPLAKVASGGELSRIGLAIHIATAKQQTIPTIIFDEVDVGVSGQTAAMIGQLLRQLGESFQVLCITHVPQVASLGHQHLKVEKRIEKNATFTSITPLDKKEKVNEIARMLGGAQITSKTLAHAEEMLMT